jgi:hypothetical protein
MNDKGELIVDDLVGELNRSINFRFENVKIDEELIKRLSNKDTNKKDITMSKNKETMVEVPVYHIFTDYYKAISKNILLDSISIYGLTNKCGTNYIVDKVINFEITNIEKELTVIPLKKYDSYLIAFKRIIDRYFEILT